MLKKSSVLISISCLAIIASSPVNAHFLELIPSLDIVSARTNKNIHFDIRFSHPMENGPVMNMAETPKFTVLVNGSKNDISSALKLKKINGMNSYTATYKVSEPGDHVFGIEPLSYWEPAEQKMIVHYTKVVINGYGAEEGWDEPLRYPVEIDPLVRPYGLWTGNNFRGVVKKKGRPVPFATVEVEYLNKDNQVTIPADPFITQVITTDINGVFSYTMPKAGWWGFAALLEGDELVESPDGQRVEVELGALMWVRCIDIEEKK